MKKILISVSDEMYEEIIRYSGLDLRTPENFIIKAMKDKIRQIDNEQPYEVIEGSYESEEDE